MKIDGVPWRTIWPAGDGRAVEIIDQTRLPHELVTVRLETLGDAARAIADMMVRGAPLIGATAAWGICLALAEDPSDEAMDRAAETLLATRPTAVDLRWAVDDMRARLRPRPPGERLAAGRARAAEICDGSVRDCESIGTNGMTLIARIHAQIHAGAGDGRPVNILTHCNAGWLACVDWGTALAPIYKAHESGIAVHVWVDETRPRNQGAALTAWELGAHGVPHTVIVDNVGGHLMQRGLVDMCITGSDRTAANGDVCNKIGTYLKALAAHDNDVPFYVALPHSTIDWTIDDGIAGIPIEERDPAEVTTVAGLGPDGVVAAVTITPAGTAAANYAFDVTPARLISGLITERGVCTADKKGLLGLYPERA